MFGAIGRLVVRHPWWTILAWVLAAVALMVIAPAMKVSNEQTDFLPEKYESVQAFELASEAFPQAKGQTAIIVATRSDGQPLTEADEQKVGDLAKQLEAKHIAEVQSVAAGPVSENRLVQMVNVQFAGEAAAWGDPKITKAVEELRHEIGNQTGGSGLTVRVTGGAAISVDSEEAYKKSDSITLMATVIVIFILLLFTFRSIVAALLPLFTVGLVMAVAGRLIGSVNEIFNLKADAMTQSLMPIVLFGVGTDYILFLLFRYRERLRAGDDKKQAMVGAVHRVGEVIASAAAAVIIAFAALVLASLGMLKSLGPAMAIAVFTTLLAALTLIPAVVSLIGPKVFWPSKSWRQEPKHARSARIGKFIGRRPVVVAVVSGLILVALSINAFGFESNFDMAAAPKGTESAKGLDDMKKGFPPGALDATQVFLEGKDGAKLTEAQTAAVASAMDATGVGKSSPPLMNEAGEVARIDFQLNDDPLSRTAMDNIAKVRTAAHDAAAGQGAEATVGGTTAIMVDLQSAMNRDYRVVFPIAGLLIVIILALLLRSLVAPIYLMIAVVLSFAATIGAGVLIFQQAMNHTGTVFFLPLVVYLFVVALGTDYNILTIARLREEARAGHPPREAVGRAFQQVAPTVASAGLILAGSFATFLLASSDALQEMGVSVAVGVTLSAFVMSMFLVPAVTVLLGHAAWWPGHEDAPRAAEPEPQVEELAEARH